jgi:hypothetical protein
MLKLMYSSAFSSTGLQAYNLKSSNLSQDGVYVSYLSYLTRKDMVIPVICILNRFHGFERAKVDCVFFIINYYCFNNK